METERRVPGLIQGTLPVFACRDWENHHKNHDSQFQARDLNSVPPKHEAEILTLDRDVLVYSISKFNLESSERIR
jgi:hypothetical protein